jgi:hypothetical protein
LFGGGVGFGGGKAVVVGNLFASRSGRFFRSFVMAFWPGIARVLAEGSFEGDVQFAQRGGVIDGQLAILWDFFDHLAGFGSEVFVAGIFYGDVQGAEHQRGALQLDGVAHESVEDFHERDLDGFAVFDERDGVKACLRRGANAAMHALVVVAEFLLAESGRAATDSGDFDMSAGFWCLHVVDPRNNFLVLGS